jgi:hypothetical protein
VRLLRCIVGISISSGLSPSVRHLRLGSCALCFDFLVLFFFFAPALLESCCLRGEAESSLLSRSSSSTAFSACESWMPVISPPAAEAIGATGPVGWYRYSCLSIVASKCGEQDFIKSTRVGLTTAPSTKLEINQQTSSLIIQVFDSSLIAYIPLIAKVPISRGRDDKSISIKWPNIDITELAKDLTPGWSLATV